MLKQVMLKSPTNSLVKCLMAEFSLKVLFFFIFLLHLKLVFIHFFGAHFHVVLLLRVKLCIFTVNVCQIRATNSLVVKSLHVDSTNVFFGHHL